MTFLLGGASQITATHKREKMSVWGEAEDGRASVSCEGNVAFLSIKEFCYWTSECLPPVNQAALVTLHCDTNTCDHFVFDLQL